MFKELVLKSRSYRRFYQDVLIDPGTLVELIDLARMTPSGRNAQPLKYFLSTDAIRNAVIFTHLAWAAYLTDWDGPAEGERPSAYIVVLLDREISQSAGCDHGIATQTILLGAAEKGLGGCIIGSVRRQELAQALNIPARFEILHVVALGKPRETVVVEPIGPQGDFKYWRDEKGVHHVPKRALDDLIIQPE
jgi:nitroreductase